MPVSPSPLSIAAPTNMPMRLRISVLLSEWIQRFLPIHVPGCAKFLVAQAAAQERLARLYRDERFFPLELWRTLFNGRAAFGESPRVGRGNPSHQARSKLGRVACAYVQPATVKAHAPMMSRFPTSGFGRRPERT